LVRHSSAIQPHIWDMDTKPLSFGKLDIGYFMENSSALCPGSATLDRFGDVSLVEEVNSNSRENYCCGVCNKVFRRKAHLVRHSSP
jgi:hypothetical protein